MQARAGRHIEPFGAGNHSIEDLRQQVEKRWAPHVEKMKQRYPVNIEERSIAGVRTRVVTAKSGAIDPQRLLINLHGGAFMLCAEACAMLEAIPIAVESGMMVVTVDYRQGPENQYPAATQDVVAVYRKLLETYRPENIGIYGCSAGGYLTGQMQAWLAREKLPLPGAVGMFGSGGAFARAGDSAYFAPRLGGELTPPADNGTRSIRLPYLGETDLAQPLISPALHPGVLAEFPPTLLITGTRSEDLSDAAFTHAQMLKAGKDSQLLVADGMVHCYIYNSDLPEARDAYGIIARFFKRHLGATTKASPPHAPVR